MTTTAITVPETGVNPSAMLAGLFGGAVSVVSSADASSPGIMRPDQMKVDEKTLNSVINACSMDALGGIYALAVDAAGAPQPGRFLRVMERYTIPGGGQLTFSRAGDRKGFPELVGAIVRIAPYRVLHGGGENPPPVCGSINLVEGYGRPGGDCANCHFIKFVDRDTPWCKQRTRVYVALRGTSTLAMIDLPAMPREGLEPFELWSASHGVWGGDFVCRITLVDHPRSPATGNSRTCLLTVKPVAIAAYGDRFDEYRESAVRANQILEVAEAAWLQDLGTALVGRDAVTLGAPPPDAPGYRSLGAGAGQTVAERYPLTSGDDAPGYDAAMSSPARTHDAMPDRAPAVDDDPLPFEPDAPVEDTWGDVDELPF